MCDDLGTDGVRVTDGMAVSEPACAASGRSVAKVVPHGGSGGHPRARGASPRTALRDSLDAKRQSPGEDPSSRGVRTVAPETGGAGYRRVGHREKNSKPLRRPRSRGWKANPWFSMHGWRRFLGRGPRIRPVNVRKRGRASWKRLDSAPCLLGAEGDDVEVVHGVLPTAGGEASVRALVGAAAADDLAGDSAIA